MFRFLFMVLLCSFCFCNYIEKDFNYIISKNMNGFTPELLRLHFKLYAGYVKNTNDLLQALKGIDDTTLAYGALKRRLGFEWDGMRLHELYFENLGGDGKVNKEGSLYQALVAEWGSYEKWVQNFKTMGMMRGVGWVILYEDPVTSSLYNVWVEDHEMGHLAGATPLLVMDVWEHAYLTEYGLNRTGYIKAFFENIDWTVVDKRKGLKELEKKEVPSSLQGRSERKWQSDRQKSSPKQTPPQPVPSSV